MERYLKFSPFSFFCLYCILFIFLTFLANYILYDDTLFYNSFGENLGIERIDAIISQQKLFQKISYGFVPIFLFLRMFYTSICLIIGALLSEQSLKFKQCLNIAIKADVIFLLELFVRIDYFSITGVNSLDEINIRLFSVLQLIGVQEPWISYPFSILNIFELVYWILLALFLSNYTKKSFLFSMGFVAKTYGLGLLLWVMSVMFLILNII
ncbi:MAG: hypothetical protein LBN93_11410 [Candidatus Symbiothrix sp.]|jgi:hypothetical protein|nr:hypothetical protein [Candidatus Symbiothrix sp.]